jgi:DNA-binding transcriptional MerR regulator
MSGLGINDLAKICRSSAPLIYQTARSASIKPRKISSTRTREFDFADAVTIVACRLLKGRGFSNEAIENLAQALNQEMHLISADEDYRPMLFACETTYGFWLTTATDSKAEAIEIINASPQSNFVNCRELYHEAQQEISKNA